MNFTARQLLYAFVVLALAFRAECLSDKLTSDYDEFDGSRDDRNEYPYTSVFDPATDTLFNVFFADEYGPLAVHRFDDGSEPYSSSEMESVDFIYNNHAIYLDKEDILYTGSLENFNSPNQYNVPHNSTSLFHTMFLDGVDENRLVILYEDSVKFATINGTNKPTFTDINDTESITGGSNFTNVGSGVVYNVTKNGKNSYYFLNFSSGSVKRQAISDKIDLSSGIFAIDKHGYVYTADGAEIIRQDINGNTKKSVLAQSSSSVVALHYDYRYDDIYATGANVIYASDGKTESCTFTLYVIPAGESFDFSLYQRNQKLISQGAAVKHLKTGTTIAAAIYKDGVILGADTRATAGPVVQVKDEEKLHYVTDNIFAAGAGTAADCAEITDLISSQLHLYKLNTGIQPRVDQAARLFSKRLFNYGGNIQAYLLVAGVDFTGPSIYSIYADGAAGHSP